MLKIFLDAAMVDPLSLVSILTSGHFDISITESNLNELLNTLPFMGTSFAFVHEEDVANITIASLFADVEDNKMTVYMVLDVNGVHCECSVNASTIQNTGAIVTLKIDSVQLGTQEITNVAQEGILRYLENVLNVDFISVNAKEDTLSLDFSNYLEDSFFHNLISSGLSKVSVVLKSTYEGEIAIRLSK